MRRSIRQEKQLVTCVTCVYVFEVMGKEGFKCEKSGL
jgi:hypothetical protein